MKNTILAVVVSIMAVPVSAAESPQAFEIRLTTARATADTEEMTLTNQVTKTTEVLHVQKTPTLSQEMVRSASVQSVEGDQDAYVEVVFTDKGRDRLAEVTRQNIEKRLVILIDGKLLLAPIIKAEIREGRAWISGRMTKREATALAAKINSAVMK